MVAQSRAESDRNPRDPSFNTEQGLKEYKYTRRGVRVGDG